MDAQLRNTLIARRRFLWIAAATALAATAGCAGASRSETTTTTGTDTVGDETPQRLVSKADRAVPGNTEVARAAMAGFGADLLKKVHGTEPNTLISPYSVYSVLAMARAGAREQTAEQLDAVLELDGPTAQGAAIAAIDAGVAQSLAAALSARQPITITASNEIWVADGLAVQQQYLDELARQFGVSAVAADFAEHPEQMRLAVNAWVSERTNELIPELFPAGSIESGTLMVLVNALYLKAAWATPFGNPVAGNFTTGAGAHIQVPMMTRQVQGAAAADGTWAAVNIPYSGQGLQMTVLAPALGSFDQVVADLDADLMAAAAKPDTQFRLTMPTFEITSTPAVQEALQAFGVVDLFGLSADLSGIAGAPGDLFATALVHQATITVDQYGTEAAAATGMAMAGGAPSPSPRELRIDRPFIFWISETITGAPLFLGVVTDPS